jgi:hypothetical protein
MRAGRRTTAGALALCLAGCSQIVGIDQDYGTQPEDASAGSRDAGEGPDSAAPAPEGSVAEAAAGIDAPSGVDAPGLDAGPDGPPDSATAPDSAIAPDSATGEDGGISPVVQVWNGSTVLGAGASSQSVTIAAVDPSRSFLTFGLLFASPAASDTEASGQIANGTQLQFARAGGSTAPALPIQFSVAEFQSGVSVQRGSTAMTSTSVDVTLPSSADPAHSFPIVTYRNTGSTYGVDDFVRAKLTGAKHLTLDVGLAAPSGVAEWQVVSFDGAAVQSGDVTMGTNQTTLTVSLPSAVTPTSTWLLLSNTISSPSGTAAELLVTGRVSSSTTVTFSRGGGGATQQITWYAVSFTNGTTVQSATAVLGDTVATTAAALTPVDPLKSLATTGGVWLRGGTTAYTTSDNPAYGGFALDIGAGAQLTLTRGLSGPGTQASADYSVVTFF